MKTKGWNVVELKKGGQRHLLSHLGGRGPGDRSRKCDCEKEETPGLSPYRQWLGGELQQRRSRLGWPSGAGPVLKVGEYVRFPPFCHLHPWLRVRPQACGTHNPQREELISAVAPNTEEKPGSWEVVRRMAWLDP